jgi:hypothetical protein
VSTLRAAGFDVAGFGDPMIALDAVESDTRIKVLATRINFGEGRLNGVALARMLRHNIRRDGSGAFRAAAQPPLRDGRASTSWCAMLACTTAGLFLHLTSSQFAGCMKLISSRPLKSHVGHPNS